MGILRLNVRVIFCILYLMKVVVSQGETLLTCSSTTQETVLNKLREVFKYPESGKYPGLQTCKWLFRAPETDLKIRAQFISLNVNCGDVLKAYNGDSESDTLLLGPECSSQQNDQGQISTTTQNNLYVKFTTDSTTNPIENGFKLEIIAGKDHSDCSVSGSTRTISLAGAYVLTSPGFPDFYPNSRTCTYTFTAANDGDQIQFDMVYMDLEKETKQPQPCYDFVKLYDGDSTLSTVRRELCGTSTSVQSFTSTGSSLTVRFESDNQQPGKGFYANVFLLGEETTTTTTTTTLTTTTKTGDEKEETTNANPEGTEEETGCNHTFFSFWNLCCNLARLCNNGWTFCKTMEKCCKYCGLSSSSFSG